jgi:hypothetical protein
MLAPLLSLWDLSRELTTPWSKQDICCCCLWNGTLTFHPTPSSFSEVRERGVCLSSGPVPKGACTRPGSSACVCVYVPVYRAYTLAPPLSSLPTPPPDRAATCVMGAVVKLHSGSKHRYRHTVLGNSVSCDLPPQITLWTRRWTLPPVVWWR